MLTQNSQPPPSTHSLSRDACPLPACAASNVTRASVTGRPCVFPALYNGQLVTDCTPISGTLSCQVSVLRSAAAGLSLASSLSHHAGCHHTHQALQVEEGVWEPCQGRGQQGAPAGAGAATTQAVRYTVGSEACVFPAVYSGQPILSCTVLEPGAPEMCQVGGV